MYFFYNYDLFLFYSNMEEESMVQIYKKNKVYTYIFFLIAFIFRMLVAFGRNVLLMF